MTPLGQDSAAWPSVDATTKTMCLSVQVEAINQVDNDNPLDKEGDPISKRLLLVMDDDDQSDKYC